MVDTFAHGLWSMILFRKWLPGNDIWLAIFFGVMPDLFSWTIYLFYRIFTKGLKMGAPSLGDIPQWTFTLYGITHSLLIFGVVATIVYFWLGHLPIWLLAWPLHILIDIPTHSREFLPTPFLWPVSNWVFPGVSWGHPVIMALNWGGILFFIFYNFMMKK